VSCSSRIFKGTGALTQEIKVQQNSQQSAYSTPEHLSSSPAYSAAQLLPPQAAATDTAPSRSAGTGHRLHTTTASQPASTAPSKLPASDSNFLPAPGRLPRLRVQQQLPASPPRTSHSAVGSTPPSMHHQHHSQPPQHHQHSTSTNPPAVPPVSLPPSTVASGDPFMEPASDHNRVRFCHASCSTAQHSHAQQYTAQHSTAQHSTAQHGTAQQNTAQHSTAQYSTAQHSTAHHITSHLTSHHISHLITSHITSHITSPAPRYRGSHLASQKIENPELYITLKTEESKTPYQKYPKLHLTLSAEKKSLFTPAPW
jgi:hypothetical protein